MLTKLWNFINRYETARHERKNLTANQRQQAAELSLMWQQRRGSL